MAQSSSGFFGGAFNLLKWYPRLISPGHPFSCQITVNSGVGNVPRRWIYMLAFTNQKLRKASVKPVPTTSLLCCNSPTPSPNQCACQMPQCMTVFCSVTIKCSRLPFDTRTCPPGHLESMYLGHEHSGKGLQAGTLFLLESELYLPWWQLRCTHVQVVK